MLHVQVGTVAYGKRPATYLTSLAVHVIKWGLILCLVLAASVEFERLLLRNKSQPVERKTSRPVQIPYDFDFCTRTSYRYGTQPIEYVFLTIATS